MSQHDDYSSFMSFESALLALNSWTMKWVGIKNVGEKSRCGREREKKWKSKMCKENSFCVHTTEKTGRRRNMKIYNLVFDNWEKRDTSAARNWKLDIGRDFHNTEKRNEKSQIDCWLRWWRHREFFFAGIFTSFVNFVSLFFLLRGLHIQFSKPQQGPWLPAENEEAKLEAYKNTQQGRKRRIWGWMSERVERNEGKKIDFISPKHETSNALPRLCIVYIAIVWNFRILLHV